MIYFYATYSVIFIFIFLYLILINKRYKKQQKDFESIKEMIQELQGRS